MTFDRFNDEVRVTDWKNEDDIVECKQCGREIERDAFAETDEYFCHGGCRADYNGS